MAERVQIHDRAGQAEAELIWTATLLTHKWCQKSKVPTASGLLQYLEAELGPCVRPYYGEVVARLGDSDLSTHPRWSKIRAALLADPLATRPRPESTVDELFSRVQRVGASEAFAEAMAFVARFRQYSAFNNMLVFLQRPKATHWARASYWRKEFGREVVDGAIQTDE